MQNLPKGVIFNPKRANRPYGVMVDDVWFYHATVEDAARQLKIPEIVVKPEGYKRTYNTPKKKDEFGREYRWRVPRKECPICKELIAISRIVAHQEVCKKRGEGWVYVRPKRRIRKRKTVRGTHFDSTKLFVMYEGELRSLFEIAKLKEFPLDILRRRYSNQKRKLKTLDELFAPIQKPTKRKEEPNHEQISEG